MTAPFHLFAYQLLYHLRIFFLLPYPKAFIVTWAKLKKPVENGADYGAEGGRLSRRLVWSGYFCFKAS